MKLIEFGFYSIIMLFHFSYGETTNTGHYTNDQIQQMIKLLKDKKVKNPHVTFPLRAGLAVNHQGLIRRLMRLAKSEFETASITVWSPPNDPLDTNELQRLVNTIGIARVYIDVPPDVRKHLNLSGAMSVAAHWVLIFASIFATLTITRVLSSSD